MNFLTALALSLSLALGVPTQDTPRPSDVTVDTRVTDPHGPGTEPGEGGAEALNLARPVLNTWIPAPQGLITSSSIGLPNAPTNGYRIEGKQVTGTWAAVIGYYQPTVNMVVTNSVIQGTWNTNNAGVFGNWTKWGLRLYDVQDFLAKGVIFRDIGNEHGAYLNVAGDVTFDQCWFYNIGSQGVQFVFRPTETSNPAWAKNPGRIMIRRTVFQQVTGPTSQGWPAGRASFTISSHPRDIGFKNPGQDLVVRDVYMEAEWPTFTSSGKQAQSFGAIMCEWHDTLRINRVWIDYTKPNTRPVIQAYHLNRMIMKNSYVKEGKIDIKDTPYVRIMDCTGDAVIWDTINGTPTAIGPVSGGYTKG